MAGQRDEAVVNFEHDPVSDTADDQGVRTGAKCLCESFFALPKRLLSGFAFGDIDHGPGHQHRFSDSVAELPALVLNIYVNAVGSKEPVFVRPVNHAVSST